MGHVALFDTAVAQKRFTYLPSTRDKHPCASRPSTEVSAQHALRLPGAHVPDSTHRSAHARTDDSRRPGASTAFTVFAGRIPSSRGRCSGAHGEAIVSGPPTIMNASAAHNLRGHAAPFVGKFGRRSYTTMRRQVGDAPPMRSPLRRRSSRRGEEMAFLNARASEG